MFDKQPKQSTGAENEIDFLHGEGGELTEGKRKKRAPRPDFVHLEALMGEQKPEYAFKEAVSLGDRIRSFFKRFRVFLGSGEPEELPLQRRTKVTIADPRSRQTRKPEPQDPFEQESGSLVSEFELHAASAARAEGIDKDARDAAQDERVKKNFERLKKIPLNELAGKSGRAGREGFLNPGKQEEDSQAAFDVNLLPLQKRFLSVKVQKIIGLSLVSVEFLGMLFLFLLLQARADGRLLALRELESRATQLEIQIRSFRSVVSDAASLHQKFLLLESIFRGRKNPNKALSWLEANTLQTIYLEDFSATLDGNFSVKVAADNVTSGAQQLKIFLAGQEWKDILVNGLTVQEDEDGATAVSYGLDIAPVPEFYQTVEAGTQQEP